MCFPFRLENIWFGKIQQVYVYSKYKAAGLRPPTGPWLRNEKMVCSKKNNDSKPQVIQYTGLDLVFECTVLVMFEFTVWAGTHIYLQNAEEEVASFKMRTGGN